MSRQKTYIMLHTYGGGMRGMIPAYFMARIEEVTGLRMAEMVDIFTGPSTGAILNAALNVPHPERPGKPKYRARHMVKFYEREGIRIFPPDRFRDFRSLIHDFNHRTMKIKRLKALFKYGHYDPAYLSKMLKALYGDTKLSDSLKSLVIPVYNIDGNHLEVVEERGETEEAPVHTRNNFVDRGGYAVWLKNIKFRRNRQATPDVSLLDSVLASTAAPTYFPCHHFKAGYPDKRGSASYAGIDGSLFDNPCISYHGAVRQHLPENSRLIMIAFGTGHTLRSFKRDDWNQLGGLGIVDPVNDLPLINILFHAPETALVESFSQELGKDIYVFNKSIVSYDDPSVVPNFQIDDASPDNVKRMKKFFEVMLEENRQKFEDVCHLLVQNRDRKQKEKETVFETFKKRFFFSGRK